MSTFTECGEFSLSIAVSVIALPEKCLLDRTRSFAGVHLQFPKWFRWRYVPVYSALLRDSLNLESTAPISVGHHVMPLDYERPVIGSVFPSKVILLIERISVY